MQELDFAETNFLDGDQYVEHLRKSHPALNVHHNTLLDVPIFTARLDTREPMRRGLLRAVFGIVGRVLPPIIFPRALFLGNTLRTI